MRMKNVVVLSIIFIFVGSMLLASVPAQTSEYSDTMDLDWDSSITVSKTYTWNMHEVNWPGLEYLGETIETDSTIEFDIMDTMPADTSAYEDYCAGFDDVIDVSINENVKTFSDVVADDYSTYLAYLIVPLEASYPEYDVYLGPESYLPIVIPASSGGEIADEDVYAYIIENIIYIEAIEDDVEHYAELDLDTGVTQLWQTWDIADESNYLTLTVDGYTGEIPAVGEGFDWENYDYETDWSVDWDWELLDVDWDEYDWDESDYDLDLWFAGTEDLDFEDMDWEQLEKDFAELADWDWEDAGLEDLGVFFEIETTGDVNHIHLEIEVELDDNVDATTVKLYYYDEGEEEWVKIETSVYNEDTGKVEADIDHLTVFAAAADDSGQDVKKDDAPGGFVAALVILGMAGAVVFLSRKK